MKYLLDTNICIHYFRGSFNLDKKFNQIRFEDFAISEITLAELVYGAECSSNPKKNYQLIDHFSESISIIPIINSINRYGKEKAKLRNKGNLISDFDLLIGCTAVENGLIMVTENIKEFSKIKDIRIENWVTR
jgi:tRNA(fMet)-specific endonuclease VapC